MHSRVSRKGSAMYSLFSSWLSITKQDEWIIAYIDDFIGRTQYVQTSTPAAEISCDIYENYVK